MTDQADGGWWTGYAVDPSQPDQPTASGLFPSSYVEATAGGGEPGSRGSGCRRPACRGERQHRQRHARCRHDGAVQALYDYQATEDGYLGLVANQEVVVTDQADGGWWTGYAVEQHQTAGLFPSSYVEVIDGAGDDAQPEADAQPEKSAGQEPSEPAPGGGVRCKALYDYEATEAGFLGLTAGQELVVTEQADGSWWTGHPVGQPQTTRLFPSSYVEAIPAGRPGDNAQAAATPVSEAMADAQATPRERGARGV